MNTLNNKKQIYTAPEIESIVLDNEISLALESAPPAGPFESENIKKDCLKEDHFSLV